MGDQFELLEAEPPEFAGLPSGAWHHPWDFLPMSLGLNNFVATRSEIWGSSSRRNSLQTSQTKRVISSLFQFFLIFLFLTILYPSKVTYWRVFLRVPGPPRCVSLFSWANFRSTLPRKQVFRWLPVLLGPWQMPSASRDMSAVLPFSSHPGQFPRLRHCLSLPCPWVLPASATRTLPTPPEDFFPACNIWWY